MVMPEKQGCIAKSWFKGVNKKKLIDCFIHLITFGCGFKCVFSLFFILFTTCKKIPNDRPCVVVLFEVIL